MPPRSRRPRRLAALAVLLALLTCLTAAAGAPATAHAAAGVLARANGGEQPRGQAVSTGTGGAAATVDVLASQAAIGVLRQGGNAVDAAVAAAAVLNVVEPYSSGIGGGGFMVVYDADRRRVDTVDHRETAPKAFRPDSFAGIPFAERVTSGLGVGVPGTVAGWELALDRYGTKPLRELLEPAIRVAERGFTVDQTFADQTAANLTRFRAFTSTRALYLTRDGSVPPVGSRLRNPDMARTLRLIARHGAKVFYEGEIADAIAATVVHPPIAPGTTLRIRPGLMTADDLARYEALVRAPARSTYRGLSLYGMAPPSSGASTIGETLNIVEGFPMRRLPRAEALHDWLEASRLAYADRGAYVGDPAFVDVPLSGLLSKGFAAERRCLIGPAAATSPVPPGDPTPPFDHDCSTTSPPAGTSAPEGLSTTHLTVADAHGGIVSYTFTIEQTGGSGIVVPGYGFLLNNELTDFDDPPSPNAPAGGKRPRSSMSPTIVFERGRPVLALGSPGGATIITTVEQILLGVVDFGMTLPEAVAAPRISQRNRTVTDAEPAFMTTPEAADLRARGHAFAEVAEIGAATGIALAPRGRFTAVAEPVRRGGGSALVVHPDRP
jgi:gamma-glutamyltranspeptidase/glutathione hydrolase